MMMNAAQIVPVTTFNALTLAMMHAVKALNVNLGIMVLFVHVHGYVFCSGIQCLL